MHLFFKKKIKINLSTQKNEGFSGWIKCTKCCELIHEHQLEENLRCCPKCNEHYRLTGTQRIQLLADSGSFVEYFTEVQPRDPLQFVDTEPYSKRIQRAQSSSQRDEGVIVGTATLKGISIALGVLDFSFMAGSMGSVVGERLTRLIELALEKRLPLIIVSASGGARMQESIFSLMQMAKTSAAIARFQEQDLLYISVLSDPTTGGVTASFATLGDLIMAEPNALIGFAGSRVVEQTIGQKLPPGAQKSEFLLEKGMIDCIVNRHDLKEKLFFFITFLAGGNNAETSQSGNPHRG